MKSWSKQRVRYAKIRLSTIPLKSHPCVREGWFVTDSTDMFKQPGAIEYTEKGKNLFPEDVK
jgi:hypothetical protein